MPEGCVSNKVNKTSRKSCGLPIQIQVFPGFPG
jgi:hypothetical protein